MKFICLLFVLPVSLFAQHLVIIPDHSAEQAAAARDAIIHAPPTDPLRRYHDKATRADGPGWYRMWGRVLTRTASGVEVVGFLADETTSGKSTFVITNFPYPFDELTFEKSWYARDAGNTTVNGRIFRLLDYELVWPKKSFDPVPPAPARRSAPAASLPPRPSLASALKDGIPAAVYNQITAKAEKDFPNDYAMQANQVERQVTAYKKIHP